ADAPVMSGGARRCPPRECHAVPAIRGNTVIIADEAAPHATDRDRQEERGRRCIEPGGDRKATLPDLPVVREHAADQAAIPHEATAAEDLAGRIRDDVVEMEQEVVDLGAENAADCDTGEHVPDELALESVPLELPPGCPGPAQERQEHHDAEGRHDEVSDAEQLWEHAIDPGQGRAPPGAGGLT